MHMRHHTLTVAVALALALAFGTGSALGAGVNVHGECNDADGNGGEGTVAADTEGNTNLLNAEEAQSIGAGLATFAMGTADDAQNGSPGEDACHSPDNPDGDDFEEEEDHLSVHAYGQGANAGACYDNEGFHTTASCHQGSGGDVPSGALALP
jgi:hypothetical protein